MEQLPIPPKDDTDQILAKAEELMGVPMTKEEKEQILERADEIYRDGPDPSDEEIEATLAKGGPFFTLDWTEGSIKIIKEFPFKEMVAFHQELGEYIESAKAKYKLNEVNNGE